MARLRGSRHRGTRLTALRLPGSSGNYASLPDSAALSVASGLDVQVWLAMDDWTPAADSTLCAKEQTTTARTFRVEVLTTGIVNLGLSGDGSALTAANSGVATGFANGTTGGVRVTWRTSDERVQFFTAPGLSSSWTQLGVNKATAALGNLFDSTSIVEIGSRIGGATSPLAGRIFRVRILNGIEEDGGTVVADVDFTRVAKGRTSFAERSANGATVTVNQNGGTPAAIVNV